MYEKYKELRSSEIGFVSSWHDDAIFCRFFWDRTHNLRTVANSEGCSPDDLFEYTFFPQEDIDNLIRKMRKDPYYYGWHEQTQLTNDYFAIRVGSLEYPLSYTNSNLIKYQTRITFKTNGGISTSGSKQKFSFQLLGLSSDVSIYFDADVSNW